jgi:endonuclease VIII
MEHRSGDDTPWHRSITWCPACQPLRPDAAVDVARIRRMIALHPALREPYVVLS